MRQLPNAPARRPPSTARTTARTMTPAVTDGDSGTATTWDVFGPMEWLTPPGPTVVCWKAPPPWVGTVADSGGATLRMIAAPANPRPTPAAAPTMPMATDSPSTWPMIRRDRQPIAFSVPNSADLRVTAAMVSRLATTNAAIRASTDSHFPRSLTSVAALDTDPVTWLARLLAVVTVSPGSSPEISFCTVGMSAALAADT